MKTERDLRYIFTWEHLKEELNNKGARKALEHHEWLVGRGLKDHLFKDRDTVLAARDLDTVEVEQPIFLLHQDGHECVLNSKAMEMVKRNSELEQFHSAFIEKDENGHWNGRFKDTAVHFIKMHFPNKTSGAIKQALKSGFSHLAEYGITHIDPDDLNYAGNYETLWQAYTELDSAEGLPFYVEKQVICR